MSELANLIEVNRDNRLTSLYIDGKEFPWWADADIKVRVRREELPEITITIPAREVRVVDKVPGA